MPERGPRSDRSEARRSSLSRWENEGGSAAPGHDRAHAPIPELNNSELVQLRIRMIALESLMIAVLAEGSDRQLDVAREMADYVAPRPGFTAHPLTVQAGDHITDLVDRVLRFRMQSGPQL